MKYSRSSSLAAWLAALTVVSAAASSEGQTTSSAASGTSTRTVTSTVLGTLTSTVSQTAASSTLSLSTSSSASQSTSSPSSGSTLGTSSSGTSSLSTSGTPSQSFDVSSQTTSSASTSISSTQTTSSTSTSSASSLSTTSQTASSTTTSSSQPAEEVRTQTFLSRPQQTSLILDVIQPLEDSSTANPGYVFIAPYYTTFTVTDVPKPFPEKHAWGPHIFDQQGNLIWHAPDGWVEKRAWPFMVCDYAGELGTHLCMNDGRIDPHGGYSNGTSRIFNSSYVEVARLTATADVPGPDGHELNVVDGGTRLLHDAYQPVHLDLTGFSGRENGSFFSGCFQDRDLSTGEAVFTWCSADYIPMDESYTHLRHDNQDNQTSLSPHKSHTVERPWDYLHINGVDKDSAGDYYVSGKTTQTIYKIAGPESTSEYPGSIIWKFAGWKRAANVNDFTMIDGLNFSGQHHPRILSVQGDTTVISLFDNALTDHKMTQTSTSSNGKIIELDTASMTARLIEQYLPPNGASCPIQGTVQRLPSGNVFMGWGPNNILTEHAPGLPGEVVWYSTFGAGLDLENYRAFKFPWTGNPLDPPDVFAYAQGCHNPIYVYMSWNGATEHREWVVYASDSGESGWFEVARTQKEGFETKAAVPNWRVPRYIRVDAVDASGKVLGTSKVVQVYVPPDTIKADYACGAESCGSDLKVYDENDSEIGLCI